jgi:gliding motility-associated-like protein
MKKNTSYFLWVLVFVIHSSYAQSPGGIACDVWTRAEKDVYTNAGITAATDGQTVQQWNDQASTVIENLSQATAANRFTYNDAPGKFLNFNPQLYFRAGQDFMGTSSATAWDSDKQTVFIVHVPDATTAVSSICGWGPTMQGPGWYFSGGTMEAWSVTSLASAPVNGLAANRPFIMGCSYSGSSSSIDAMGFRNNGMSNYSGCCSSLSQAGNDENFYIGNDAGMSGNGGYFSEVIVFKKVLTQAEMQQVDSYLAIKYGITLSGTLSNNQVTDGNYLFANGTKVWTYPGYEMYHNEVTGIARDDASALYQKVSKSSFNTDNNALVISVDTNFTLGNYSVTRTATLADGQALIFGNDQGSTTSTQTTNLDNITYNRRCIREWKVENTGAVGPVSLFFPTLPALTAGEFYVALADADGDFSSGAVPLLTSDTTTFKNITLPPGINYFTIAVASLKVEYTAASSDLEASGGNLPQLLIRGLSNGTDSITIKDLGTGTATSGTDYILSPIVMGIPKGAYDGTTATALTIPLKIIDDCREELNETIKIFLINPKGHTEIADVNADALKQDSTIYTIINDDITPGASIAGTTTVCQNTSSPNITFTGLYGTAPFYFTYSINGGTTYSVSTSGSNTTLNASIPTTTTGSYTLSLLTVSDAKTYSTTCVVTLTNTTATVLVNPAPAITTMTVSSCAGATFTSTPVDITNGIVPAGTTYSWALPAVTGGVTGAITGTNQANVIQTLNNPTTSIQTATYSVVPTSGLGCAGIPYKLTATLSAPVSIADTTLPTICSANSFSLTPVTGLPIAKGNFVPAGTTYNWSMPTVMGGMTGASAQTNKTNIIETLSNPTTIQQTATYTITPYSAGCPSPSFKLTVNVNPSPTASISGTSTVCLGVTTSTIAFTGITGNAPYTFTYNINGGTSNTVSSSGTSTTVAVPTSLANSFTYSLISVADNLCSQPQSGTATVKVNVLPTATFGSDITVCQNGAAPVLIFTGANGSNPYVFGYTINHGAVQTVSGIAGNTTATISVLTNSVTTYTYSLVNVQEGSTAACSQNQTKNVLATIIAPSQGTVTASATRTCQRSASPQMSFTGSVGQAPYIFYYSTTIPISGTTTHSVLSVGNTATVSVPTNRADTLIYTITDIQDASGIRCGIGGSVDSVIIDSVPLTTITVNSSDVCLNDPNQIISFTGSGMTAPVTFNYYTSVNGGPNQTQSPIFSVAPSLTATLSAPAAAVGTTVYKSAVAGSGACSGTANDSLKITVHALPSAVISSSSPSTVCQTATAQILFKGSAGTAPYTFSYTEDGVSNTIMSPDAFTDSVIINASNVVGTHNYILTNVKDAYNCKQPKTGTITVVVDPLPTASGSGSSSICMNGTATISAISAANGSINWDANGTGAGTINNGMTTSPTYAADASDAGKTVILTMTVTSTNTCNLATATATYTVLVDSLPLAIAGGSTNICQGGNKVISGTFSKYGSILWTHNGLGTLSNLTTLNPTYVAVANDAGKTVTLTMTVTATNNCKPQPAKAFYTITVDSSTAVGAGSKSTICENSIANISATSSASGSINWTHNGSGSIANGTSLTPTYTAAAGDAGKDVLLIMTAAGTNSCAGQTATTTYTVHVDSLPTATSEKSRAICVNSSYQLKSGEATMANATVVSWSTNGAGSITSGGNSLTPAYTPVVGDVNNPVILTLKVSSNNTCLGDTAQATYTITVDSLPIAASGGDTTICENSSYQLQIGEATVSYANPSWTSNGAGSITFGQSSLTPIYKAATGDAGKAVVLTLTANSNNACIGNSTNATYTVNVDPLPFAVAGPPPTICESQFATIAGAKAKYGTVSWSSNGKGVLNNTTSLSPQYMPVPADQGKNIVLTMTVTSTNTCKPQSKSDVTIVNILPALSATLSAEQTVCQNQAAPVQFGVTSQGTSAYTFTYTETINGISTTKTVVTPNGSKTTTINAPTNNLGQIKYELLSVQDANCLKPLIPDTQIVTILPSPMVSISKDVASCRDSLVSPIVIKGLNGKSPYIFTYTTNDSVVSVVQTNDSIVIKPSTEKAGSFVYSLVSVSDANCYTSLQNLTAKAEVYENPHAIFTLSPERTSLLEPEITIKDASTSASSYKWTFGDGTMSNSPDLQKHSYTDTGTYKIKLLLYNSVCKDSTSQLVRIYLPTSLYVPSAFTPNADGVNDVFKAEGDGILTFEMMIYDRWGNMVFQSNDINKGWDGKANKGGNSTLMDTYVYVINIRALANKHDYTYRGMVNVVR